jgi:hypothetical protein
MPEALAACIRAKVLTELKLNAYGIDISSKVKLVTKLCANLASEEFLCPDAGWKKGHGTLLCSMLSSGMAGMFNISLLLA